MRKKINIDIAAEFHEKETENVSCFGLELGTDISIQMKSLQYSDKVVRIIDQIIDGKLPIYIGNVDNNLKEQALLVFRSLHSSDFDKEVSKFLINQYYKDCILSICNLYGAEMKSSYDEFENNLNELDDDIHFVTHNTEVLIKLYNKVYNNENTDQVNFKEFREKFLECIHAIKEYPINGSELHKILTFYINGENECSIALKMNRSRTYIRSKFQKGLNVLSFLIWGCSIR